MRGNGRVAVSGAVVRMSIGTIPCIRCARLHKSMCTALRSVLVANPALRVLQVQPKVNCWLQVKIGPCHLSPRSPHRRYPARGTTSPLHRALFRLRMTTASSHSSPWYLHRRHPAQETVSPLLRSPIGLRMTTASGHLSPWNLHRHHPAPGTASPLLRSRSRLPMTTASSHPVPFYLHQRHPA